MSMAANYDSAARAIGASQQADGALEALNKRLLAILATAHEHASNLRYKADTVFGSVPESVGPKDPEQVLSSALGELNDTIDRLANALDDIGRQSNRFGKLTTR